MPLARRLLTGFAIAAALAGCSAPPAEPKPIEAAEKPSDKPLFQQTPKEIDVTLRHLARTPQPLPERAVSLARRNLGQPYELYLLGEAPFETIDDQPVYCLEKSDCVVFVEHTLAMSLSPDFPSFLRLLQRIRYANGEVGVRTRNHYTEADWNVSNRWLMREITGEVASAGEIKTYVQRVDREKFFKGRYKIEVPTPIQTVTEQYIPNESIDAIKSKLRDGDVFESVKGSATGGGEFVHHLGFVTVKPDGSVNLLHSNEPRVLEQTIESYIAAARAREARQSTTRPNTLRHRGFRFFRLNDDALAKLRAIDGDATPRVTLPPDSKVTFDAFVAQSLGR